MRVVTASEMREIDRRAIEDYGMPSLDLMERAGGAAAHVIASAGLDAGSKVVVLCGKGNNGGDGFVAARYLQEGGASVTAWVLGERDELTTDATLAYQGEQRVDPVQLLFHDPDAIQSVFVDRQPEFSQFRNVMVQKQLDVVVDLVGQHQVAAGDILGELIGVIVKQISPQQSGRQDGDKKKPNGTEF